MKKKKIVFVDQSLNGGGAERVMCTVIRNLDPEKFEIHLILVSDMGDLYHLIPKHVKLRVLGIPNTRKALVNTVKVLRQIQPDIVYITTIRCAILVLFARYFSRLYRVILRFPAMPSLLSNLKMQSKLHSLVMKLLCRKADYIIAQSNEMFEELTSYLGISAKKIVTIQNPLDVKNIEKCLEDEKNPFDHSKINIVGSGTIYPIKGFDILIKAFADVVKKDKRFCLHILGRDCNGNKAKLIQLTSMLGISEHVLFHGFQANPYPFYKYCDLFVLSSRAETLPNVLIECQYLGKAVVATRCVPIVERLIKNGKNGYLVKNKDIDEMKNAILRYNNIAGEKKRKSNNGIVELIEKVALIIP